MMARRILLLAALATMFLGSACGGDSDSDGQADEGSGGTDGAGGTSSTGGQAATGGRVGSGGTSTGGAGTGASSTGGQGDGGSSSGQCPETDLLFTFDGEVEEDGIMVTGTPSSLLLQTAVPMPTVPNFSLSILGIDGEAAAPLTLDLADGPRIDWSLGSNGSGIRSAIVSTMPSGGNQLPGDFSGTLRLVEVGAEADDVRCGTIDFSLDYVDDDDASHTFTAEGSFQTVLSPPEMP